VKVQVLFWAIFSQNFYNPRVFMSKPRDTQKTEKKKPQKTAKEKKLAKLEKKKAK
jgi:hypothetical protein